MGSDWGSQGSGNSAIWLGYTQGALPWSWIRVGVSTGLHLYLLFLLRLLKKIPIGQCQNRTWKQPDMNTEWRERDQEQKRQVWRWMCICKDSSSLMQKCLEIWVEYSEWEQAKTWASFTWSNDILLHVSQVLCLSPQRPWKISGSCCGIAEALLSLWLTSWTQEQSSASPFSHSQRTPSHLAAAPLECSSLHLSSWLQYPLGDSQEEKYYPMRMPLTKVNWLALFPP